MALVITEGNGLVSIVHSSVEGTSPFVCTIGVALAAEGTSPLNAANAVFNAWEDWVMPIMDSDMKLEKCTCAITEGGVTGSVDSTFPAVVGGRSIEGTPWSMAAIVRKHTDVLGRAGKGRMYVPALLAPGEVSQGGRVGTTRRATIDTAFAGFYSALVDGDVEPTVPLLLLHDETSPVGEPTSILALTCGPLVGWIRKRIR